MYGYIYLEEDTTNGKRYIGQHKYDEYFSLDENYHGSGRIIQNIYKKRPHTLKMEYLMPVETLEEANFFEKYWIEKLNTMHPNGYNLNTGGDRGVLCDVSRKKISETLKGFKFSEDRKKHISESLKGNIPWNKGVNMSEEQKKKLSESHTNGKLSKPVLQYTLDGEFVAEYPSTMEVKRHFLKNSNHITEVCNNKRKSAYGYLWKYKK